MRKLLLDENFVDNELNQGLWNTLIGNKWANQELQAYTSRKDNLSIFEGKLHIIGLHESYMEREYTSARISTKGKFSFQRGLVEVEAKIPTGVGSWPAIWLLPNDVQEKGWPRCGEIDIMEHCGDRLDEIFFSIHTADNNHVRGNQHTLIKKFNNLHTDFHKFGFLWEENRLTWLIDDEEVFFVNKPDDAYEGNWPFDKEYFLIINMAIGGTFCHNKVNNNDFPFDFVIKSIKIYGENI